MAAVLHVFPVTQESTTPPKSFPLEGTTVYVIHKTSTAVVKKTTLATNLHLVDTAAVNPTVMELGSGLSLVNHGALTRAQINAAILAFATQSGLIPRSDAGGTPAKETVISGGAAGSDISATLSATSLLTGYTAP